jgi:hypothetical protein
MHRPRRLTEPRNENSVYEMVRRRGNPPPITPSMYPRSEYRPNVKDSNAHPSMIVVVRTCEAPLVRAL